MMSLQQVPVPVPFIRQSPPGPKAPASVVRRWLANWFEERGISNEEIQKALPKVWWNGKDIRSRSGWMAYGMEQELREFGFKWYSQPIANHIAEALKPEKVSLVILCICFVYLQSAGY
jgi:hypothetical protein